MRALVLGLSILALTPANGFTQTLKLPPIQATFKPAPAQTTWTRAPFTMPIGAIVRVTTPTEEPIDCAMVRQAQQNVDPNMPVVKPPPDVNFTIQVRKVPSCKR